MNLLRTKIIILMLFVAAAAAAQSYIPEIIKLNSQNPEEELASLLKRGVKVERRRGNLLLAYVPANQPVQSSAAQRKVRRNTPALDKAHKWYGADRIGRGEGLPHPYTGHGVVAGFCDIGFDPMHIAFRAPDGSNRVRRVVCYREEKAERTVLEGDEAYRQWVTDTDDEQHATHVAGIMAGSFSGNDYSGVATDADIVATVSRCSDVGLLAGAEDIIEYAREQGKPAVINMSMGSYLGPHDGSSLFCQYLDLLAEDAIVCLSSGNEGNSMVNIPIGYSEGVNAGGALLYSSNYTQFEMDGYLEAWSEDSRPFSLRLVCFDEITMKEEFALDWVTPSEDFETEFVARHIPAMKKHFRGSIMTEGGISPENGRRFVRVTLNTNTDEARSETEPWARWIWGVEVKTDEGARVQVFCDRSGIWYRKHPRYPAPVNSMSVSDLATGHNSVSIGMYVNRSEVPLLNGGTFSLNRGYVTGEITADSSYGTLADGRVLPLTVAPGNMLVSAYSAPYLAKHSNVLEQVTTSADIDGTTHYWGWNSGTSMSSPYVAGYIATWLEANPRLRVGDVQRIIAETNDTSKSLNDDPRNGCGWFRPYEGLLQVMGGSGIFLTPDDRGALPRLIWSGKQLDLFNAAALPLQLSILTPDGREVFRHDAGTEIHSSFAPALSKGIYIATLNSGGTNYSSLKFAVN